ncbi:ABC transporter permease [Allonocardiopsis opalescens]|uniref:Monosaccharide ABC transporter membrane protein (CUT2 family) n=1 Tax=Allonocardiopsis opalescens TaxID=1144618 RepID=A0A2T0PYY7_9ACTN|nr:ABC transporter permease [Allonocardiopsis opalescens]PRX96738.1 monosaccharide ABC transporter membrane protein (CUT2 family) [Allonocardiopsis opalescens]
MADLALARVRPDRTVLLRWLRDYGVYAGVAALVLVNLALTPNFASLDTLRVQAVQVTPILIVALGMAVVIGTGGIDLSVGAVMAVAASMISLYLGYGPVAAVLAALLAGAVSGLVAGSLVAFVGVQPIVATLALMIGGRGLAEVMLPQLDTFRNPELRALGSGMFLGVPYVVLIAVALTLVVVFVVRRTTFGRQVLAIGGNPAASALAGLPVRRVLIGVYVLAGVLAAVAGVLATARLGASDPTRLGELMELNAITAVVIGGTALTGGRVRIAGTVAGAVLMQLLTATLIMHNLPQSWTQIASAVVIVLAVWVARERGRN